MSSIIKFYQNSTRFLGYTETFQVSMHFRCCYFDLQPCLFAPYSRILRLRDKPGQDYTKGVLRVQQVVARFEALLARRLLVGNGRLEALDVLDEFYGREAVEEGIHIIGMME